MTGQAPGVGASRPRRQQVSDQPATAADPGLAVNDPVALAKGAAIVRTALARQRLTLADLTAPAGDGDA